MSSSELVDVPAGVYVYAILESPCDALDDALASLSGATVGEPSHTKIADRSVIIGAHDGGEILQTRRRMLAHTRVLETAMTMVPVLPMRFGHVATDTTELERLLHAHSDAINAQFERLNGLVEIGLRVSFPTEAALNALLDEDADLRDTRNRLLGRGAEAHFERVELGRRVAETLGDRRLAAQRALLSAIKPLCVSYVLKAPEDDVEILRAECLIDEASVEALSEAAEEAARRTGFAAQAEPDVRVVGPVPPYNFVDLNLSDGE